MKRNNILIVAIIVAILAAIWWTTRNKSNPSPDPAPPGPVKHSSGRPPASEALKELPIPFNATTEQRRAIDEENERRHAEFMNIPIIFYGRVVDQDSKPLAGVQIMPQVKRSTNLVEHYAEVNPVTKCQPVFTDASGKFVIQGYRGFLLDFGLRKEGYRGWGGGARYDRRLPDCHKPDPDKPVEFMLISDALPMAEEMCHARLRFAWNKGPVTKELGASLGTLILTPKRHGNDPTNRRQAFDWSMDVQATDFGMALLAENDLKVAPLDGYHNDHNYDYPHDAKDWQSSVTNKYAIRTTDGKYGLMEITFYGDEEDNGVCGSVTIYLNKSGARNIDHK